MLITFDTEAESLNLRLARPWQIAMVGANLEYSDRIAIHDLSVSKGAAIVTRFNKEQHDRLAISPEKIIDKIEKILTNPENTLTGHNILGYDIYIIRNFFDYMGRKFDIEEFASRCYDTLALSRAYKFECTPPAKSGPLFLAWQYKMLSKYKRGIKTGLAQMAKEFDIEVDESKTHDAIYDTNLNKKVYAKLAYEFGL